MSLSNTRSLYHDCFRVLDRALEKDLRVKFDDRDIAMNFRFRIYKARSIDREDNKSVYPPDHPSYGLSPYDALNVRIVEEDEHWYVYLTTRDSNLIIEDL